MDNETKISGFLAVTELYLRMTEKHAEDITEDEINSLIANINNSNLSMLLQRQES